MSTISTSLSCFKDFHNHYLRITYLLRTYGHMIEKAMVIRYVLCWKQVKVNVDRHEVMYEFDIMYILIDWL